MFEQLVVGGKVELFKKSRRIKENGETKEMLVSQIMDINDETIICTMPSRQGKMIVLEDVMENPYDLFYYGKYLVKEYPEQIYELCYKEISESCAQAKVRRDGLRAEVEAVAKAKGIDLSMINAKSGRGSAVKASARYSTLQDIDSGRHTEIDMFSGAMMRMGKELGIPTPYNEYTYHMIKALEEKNDGVFEYQGENDRVSWSK